jgi:hypothetical protein
VIREARRKCGILRTASKQAHDAEMLEVSDAIDWAVNKISDLERQLAEAKGTISHLQGRLHEKNLMLDALHYVWCSGGCEGGVHRHTDEKLTVGIVGKAVRNTQRLISYYVNMKGRERGETEGYEKIWNEAKAAVGAAALAGIEAQRDAAIGRLRVVAKFQCHTAQGDSGYPLADRFPYGPTLTDDLGLEAGPFAKWMKEARKALRLPILFYKGGPLEEADIAEWEAATGTREVTTKVMCDAIRRALGDEASDATQACCGLYDAKGMHSPNCPTREKTGD